MEHEHHPHHHPHGTGVRWLDIVLGVSAAIVSLVSLWLGVHSAHSMEKLVAANSYPYVELLRSSTSGTPAANGERKLDVVEYQLDNNGVGPARIEWVEMRFKDRPVANLDDLLDACCGKKEHDTSGMNRRGGIRNALIPPRASLPLFTWTEQATPNPDFVALHRQMNEISWSACYCSVFDECYIRRTIDDAKAQPVEHCAAPAVAFQPKYRHE